MARGRSAALVFVAVLSGCVGTDATVIEAAAADPQAPQQVQFSASKGGIRGSVVDETLYPLVGANVTLEEASTSGAVLAATQSATDGSFVFSLLDPGTFRLRAVFTDYGSATNLVHVAAAEVAEASLVLKALPSDEAYLMLFLQRGLMKCAYSYVAYADSCNFSSAFGQSKNSFRYNVTAGHQRIVVETDWPRKSITMDHDFLAKNLTDANATWKIVGRGFGKPVLRVDFWPEKIYEAPIVGTKVVFPPTTEGLVFRADTYFDGQYQEEVNAAVGPGCRYMLLGYCTGIGVELDYRFDQYFSIFMNGLPPDVEGYSAVPDT